MRLSNRLQSRVSISDLKDAGLKVMVEAMESVTLPSDFWTPFQSEVGKTDEIHQNHELLTKLTKFQHYAQHKRTSKLVRSYKKYNSLISLEAHDQGLNAFTCWAFSAASMIRNSCRIMIEDLKQKGLLDELRTQNGDMYGSCMAIIDNKDFHVQTRNAILMILTPRQLHIDDKSQAAFLRAAVSRLANETIIDREGVFYLKKVFDLVCNDFVGLGLRKFAVSVTYKTYYNNNSPDYENGSPLINQAVKQKLCPVAAVDNAVIPGSRFEEGTHAMVLDTIHENKFIFKNTLPDNKQVAIPVEEGPLEFYFVHIELTKEGIRELKLRSIPAMLERRLTPKCEII